MDNIYFHIGLHKTGTTYLQKKYFPKLPIKYIKGSKPFFNVINFIAEHNEKILISEENLSGQLFSGKKNQQFINTISSIKSAYPNAKIIIGFRKHSDFIISAYKQALQQGETFSFVDFYNDKDTGFLKKRDINFKQQIDFIKERFNDVFVYTIEDVKNIDAFNRSFSKFLNIEVPLLKIDKGTVNKSIKSNFQVNALLKLNQFDAFFKKNMGIKILYSKIFKFLRITPRNICQNYLPSNGKNFMIDEQSLKKINQEFQVDWDYVIKNKCH